MSWTESAFEALARRVGLRTGLTFAEERRPGAELSIRRAMARAREPDPARYLDRVARDDALLDDLIGELTIGETYFFREPAQFQFIRDAILPELRRSRAESAPIRAWSAGCSSGEEAYSLAMLFEEEGLFDRTYLLATDLARGAIEKARAATYSDWSLRGEGASSALRHLSRDGDRYVVAEPIRSRVVFESLNLALDLYPSFANGTWGMDLILCRNVLIYLDRATVRNVARRLHASLAEGGWLIAASADPILSESAPFEVVATDHGLFYRRRPRPAATTRPRAIPAAPPAREGPDEEASPSREEILATARADLARGDYGRAADRTRALIDDAEARAIHVRALAGTDPALAERACAEAAARLPLATELHYLRALLLLGLGRDREAARAARRAVYLDRSLALPHFLLGSILQRCGDRAGARRSYRNAEALCADRPGDEVVPLSDGEPAGRLAEAARVQRERLEAVAEETQ